MAHRQFDLMLTGATAVGVGSALETLNDAVIGISGSRIAFVGTQGLAAAGYSATRTIALAGPLATPGFVHAHTHTILTMVRAVAEAMWMAAADCEGEPHSQGQRRH